MKGAEFIAAVRRQLREKQDLSGTDREVAEHLGITVMAVHNWKNRDVITTRQMVGLFDRARRVAVRKSKDRLVRTVVEFFEIDEVQTAQGASLEVFGVADGNLYRKGLRDELEAHKGVYIFYDSRGRALYVGRTIKLTLWRELNSAFNRPRDAVQKIRKVDHPERNQPYKTSEEKTRHIRERPVPLSDIASYFSAYSVADGAIKDVEALLIRGFPNDLLNIRMENLSKAQPNAP